jgi:hypothetical protein
MQLAHKAFALLSLPPPLPPSVRLGIDVCAHRQHFVIRLSPTKSNQVFANGVKKIQQGSQI